MIILYNLVLISLAITLLPLILIAFILQPKFRAGFWEKIGFYKANQQIIKYSIILKDKKITKEYTFYSFLNS